MKKLSTRPGTRVSRLRAGVVMPLFMTLVLSACSIGGSGSGTPISRTNENNKVEQPGKFADGSSMAAIQRRGKLVVGLPTDLPRFAFDNPTTGSLEGFDVEIARLMASGIFGAQIEGKVEFIPLDPRDRGLSLRQNKIDIALGRFPVNADNKLFADFAGPYFLSYQTVIAPTQTANRNERVNSVIDLNGRKVCTVRGSTKVEALREAAPQVDVSTEMATAADCAAELTAGRVSAIAAEHVDLIDVQQSNTRLKAISQPETLGRENYGIGVSNQKIDLRQYLNDRLESIVKDKRWEEALGRTIGEKGQDDPPAVERY